MTLSRKLKQLNIAELMPKVMPYLIFGVIGWLVIFPMLRTMLPFNIPFPDIIGGIAIGGMMKLFVHVKGKNAKKWRKDIEYGSARWGTSKDIKPFIDLKPENNIILTKTESLTMNSRLKNPEYNRNKNILVIGGSGSGKTRFFVKPNIMQCESKDYPVSFVVTDPKGTVLLETGRMLEEKGYKIKVLNTIDFTKSNKYNPLRYIRNENDILSFVTTLIANTKGEGNKGGDDFWVKAETLLYMALIGYIHYELNEESQNMITLVELLNDMEASEEDENLKSLVDVMFDDLENDLDNLVEEYNPDGTPIIEIVDDKPTDKIRQRKRLEGEDGYRQPDDPARFAIFQYRSYKQAAGKTAKSILISCAARLAPFSIQGVRKLLREDEMDIDFLGGYKVEQNKKRIVTKEKTDSKGNAVYKNGKPVKEQVFKMVKYKAKSGAIRERKVYEKEIVYNTKTGLPEKEEVTVRDKHAYFVIISDTDATFNFIVSLFYTQLFNRLVTKADNEFNGRLPVHVRCLLDEFANIGIIPEFDKKIATIRSREISACVILQAQSQLKAIYKDNMDTIVGNMDTTLFLGGKEKTTLKDISETLGKETIDMFNTSQTYGQSQSHGQNYQKLGKELMSVDEISVMPRSKCILQISGVRPFLSNKFDITSHDNYKMLSDENPKHTFIVQDYWKREAKRAEAEEESRQKRIMKEIEDENKLLGNTEGTTEIPYDELLKMDESKDIETVYALAS